jgi:hypothetical protein
MNISRSDSESIPSRKADTIQAVMAGAKSEKTVNAIPHIKRVSEIPFEVITVLKVSI